MPGRGPQTFKKRQREQQLKERQQEKIERRLARKHDRENGTETSDDVDSLQPIPDSEADMAEARTAAAASGQ